MALWDTDTSMCLPIGLDTDLGSAPSQKKSMGLDLHGFLIYILQRPSGTTHFSEEETKAQKGDLPQACI